MTSSFRKACNISHIEMWENIFNKENISIVWQKYVYNG